jgi:hypothetical protein
MEKFAASLVGKSYRFAEGLRREGDIALTTAVGHNGRGFA